jgi:hypothetical protein
MSNHNFSFQKKENKPKMEARIETSTTDMFKYAECFIKSFTTLTAYINLFKKHVQCFELS